MLLESTQESEPIDALLDEYSLQFACSYSKLEYKRVVLQNLALILRYLVDDGKFSSAYRKASRIRGDRKPKTLGNLLSWIMQKVDGSVEVKPGESLDEMLCIRAQSYIRIAISFLWKRFDKSVDSVRNQSNCQRAAEAPIRRSTGTYDLAVHKQKCRDRACNNANFYSSLHIHIISIRDRLEQLEQSGGSEFTDELKKALDMIRRADQDRGLLYDYKNCLAIGDIWIHLEAVAAKVLDFATTNYRESQILCPCLGLNMVNPAPPAT